MPHRLLTKSALPCPETECIQSCTRERKAARTKLYTRAHPAVSPPLQHRPHRVPHSCVYGAVNARTGSVYGTVHATVSPISTAPRPYMLLYTLRRPVQLDDSLRALVSRRAVVSLRYQLVAHPDPLRFSVQPLPAHLVLIEGETEIVVDVLPVNSIDRL